MWKRVFSRDIRHLHIAFFLIGVAAVGLQVARSRMVPPSFGEYGPYRARALDAYDAQAVVWQTDAVCLKCHVDIGEERAEAAHNVVRCWQLLRNWKNRWLCLPTMATPRRPASCARTQTAPRRALDHSGRGDRAASRLPAWCRATAGLT